ncbi:MAG: sigma-70 family RNA polymerase sigma factor [Planctomycetota bacterium]
MSFLSSQSAVLSENCLKNGEHDGFEAVVLPHIGSVHAFAMSLVREAAGADDLLQDTLLRAFRAFGTFRPGTDCRSWLFRICKNRFYDLCRRRTRRPHHLDVEDVQPVALELSWEVQKEQERLEKGLDPQLDLVGDRLREALDQLPGDFREPLLLCDLDGLSYQEIAEKLSVPIGTIRSRISRARNRLRQQLHEYATEYGYVDTADQPPSV